MKIKVNCTEYEVKLEKLIPQYRGRLNECKVLGHLMTGNVENYVPKIDKLTNELTGFYKINKLKYIPIKCIFNGKSWDVIKKYTEKDYITTLPKHGGVFYGLNEPEDILAQYRKERKEKLSADDF